MATILFQAAGAAIGGIFGPVGAVIGRAAGAMLGSALDSSLLNGSTVRRGSRLSNARLAGAEEGEAIPRLYGTMRMGGTLIWATRFEEEVVSERAGGKGGGARVENFRYYANLAIGLCEGPLACIRRVWADGREIDLTGVEMRFYRGAEDQQPDPLIEARQGAGAAPAYRGLAYVVFERLPLDNFGNRIPLFQFEAIRPVGVLEGAIRAVTIIPGATEAGYATQAVTETGGDGALSILNRHMLTAATDWQVSLDELTALCPNLESVALVVSWFGTDLRAGHCRILPGVEAAERASESLVWQVTGLEREAAHPISHVNGGPAYGSTPSDESVLQAIADLKARGLKVFLYPFMMMDIPPGNGLPDPHGGAEQAAYPWRGRITAHGGLPVEAQVAAFHDAEDGYRRFILHYAGLVGQAGGVDGFILGSELRGLTALRDAAGNFPFVQKLMALAGEARGLLGPATKLTYAADWSEYFGYQPTDGSGDVFFHLDPLWAHPAIDAVGIDNYMPLSDWRDDDLAGENPDGFRLAEDAAAMRAQITAGEGFDWFYASDADRQARRRTPITDGLAGKPWVFRYKDLRSWWSNPHFDRVGGAEKNAPTPWVPGSKPLWFTELGCPAVDKGAGRPNVFLDPKSGESALPYFSSRARADSQQRRFLEAHLGHWRGGGPVDPAHIFLWSWDARPYPAFPTETAVWTDGENWRTGHWLNGRLGTATLADALAAILTDHGVGPFDVSGVSGDLGGYAQADMASARDLIEPLMEAFQVDMTEEGGVLVFRSRMAASLPPATLSVLADVEDEPLWSETRGHDSDFPAGAILSFSDPANDYEMASVRSRHAVEATSARLISDRLPASCARETAQGAVEARLRAFHLSRRTVSFALPPQEAALTAGDAVRFAAGPTGRFLVTRIEDGALRRVEAREYAPALAAPMPEEGVKRPVGPASSGFAPLVRLMDLPRYEEGEAASFARVAAYARPWRRIAVSSSSGADAFRLRARLERPARTGRLAQPLHPGVSGRFDRANALTVDMAQGEFASASEIAVLNGANRMAVLAANGAWEVLAFATAEEIQPGRWRLSNLLRTLAGTGDAMAAGAPAESAFVLLDEAVQPLGLAAPEAGLVLNYIAEAAGAAGGMAGPYGFSGGLRAVTPLAPVHARAMRGPEGVALRWTRCGRVDADNWQAAEIPLDEESLGFRVEVLAGGAAVRGFDVSEPALLYSEADELADFGARQESLSLRIRQTGRMVALGLPLEAHIAVQ